MTSKERAHFRAMANSLEPEFQIGKNGMTQALTAQTLDSFRTKELIKIKVLLDSAPDSPRDFAEKLAASTGSEVIQVIGGIIVLYKENPELNKKQVESTSKKKTKPLTNVKAKKAAAQKKEARENAARKKDFYEKKRSSAQNGRSQTKLKKF